MENILQKLPIVLIQMVIFIISGSIHEFAHAFSAYVQGDDTAKKNNRLSINPLKHIDIVGTIIFPLFGAFSGLPVFGWMKPVPINPTNFKNPSRDFAISSFAGPFSNLIQAIIALLSMWIINYTIPDSIFFHNIYTSFYFYLQINIVLMIFNLLPFPPLDGGWILRHFLPNKAKSIYDKIYPFGFVILCALLITNLLDLIINPPIYFAYYLASNMNNINIIYILIPLSFCIVITILFLKNFVLNYKKRTDFIKDATIIDNNRLKEELIKNDTAIKYSNGLLTKLKFREKFDSNDEIFISNLKKESDEIKGEPCDDLEFSNDDDNCINCSSYKKCLSRRIDLLRKQNK